MPASEGVPALDPEEACQHAIDAGLVVHRAHPLNCETSIPALVGGVVMPNARFYMRNNFRMPTLDAAAFRLGVGGLVERPLSFTVRDLQNMRSKTLVVTLECAGNGRALFERPHRGEKWGLGAVSTAEWTGVPLVEVLDRAGVRPEATEVLFRGADGGTVDGRPEPDALRAQPPARRRARQRRASGLRHERRAACPSSTAIRCVSSFRAGTRWRRSSG